MTHLIVPVETAVGFVSPQPENVERSTKSARLFQKRWPPIVSADQECGDQGGHGTSVSTNKLINLRDHE